MTIDRILAIIATITAFIAVPASGYLSYHYAIKGEKRKEWNLAATPIRAELINQIDAIERGEYSMAKISRNDLLSFIDTSGGKRKKELISAFDEFEKAHSFEELWEVTAGRHLVTGDTSGALAASKKLLSLIERK